MPRKTKPKGKVDLPKLERGGKRGGTAGNGRNGGLLGVGLQAFVGVA